MSLRTVTTLILLVAAGTDAVAADTRRVPQEHGTIQAAIDAAQPGDTVLVEPGTYRECIRLQDRITVRSAGDDRPGAIGLQRAEATIIDGTGAEGPAVVMADGAVLDGFTVTNVGKFDQQAYDKHHAERGENLADERGAVGPGGAFPALAVPAVTAVVRHNIVRENGHAGIGCSGGPGKRNASLISKNVCCRNMGGGIGIADGATPVVEGNRCFHNLRAGIGARDGARPTITGNTCFRNTEAGIGIRSAARAMITGNECYENGRAGIGQRGDAETVVEGNSVHHNKAAGIGFDECTSGRATVLNNKVVENGEVAIGIHAGWSVRVAANELSRTGGLPPLVMVFAGAEADFSDNTIRGSGIAGIRTAAVVRITGNTFVCPTPRQEGGPPQFAVWALPGSEVVCTGNTVEGWRHALVAEQAAVSALDNRVSGYSQVGMRVSQPMATAVVIGNAFQSEAEHSPVSVTGGDAIVEDNRVETPPAARDRPRLGPESGGVR